MGTTPSGSLILFLNRIARWRVERRLASRKNEAWRLKGAAWDSAFSAQMFAANPELSAESRRAYEWAEKEFLRIAGGKITVDEAVCGYGG